MSNKSKTFQGRDTFSRMNFLLQASMLMAGRNNSLSCYYGNMCKSIGKKSVLRLEPNVKRLLCKKCCLAQKPGRTAEIEASAEGNNNTHTLFEMICKKCGQRRSFRINPEYNLWLENPKSVAEAITLEEKKSTKRNKRKQSKNLRHGKNGIMEKLEQEILPLNLV